MMTSVSVPTLAIEVNRVLTLSDGCESYTLGKHTLTEDMLIVQVDISINRVFAINIDSTPKLPASLPFDALCKAIEQQHMVVVDMAWDTKVMRPFELLSEREQNKAQSRYELIAPLIKDLDATIRNSHGDGLFRSVIESSGRSRQYVYDCFNAYLYYGQRKAALALSIGKNIFHVPKATREITLKQGRPNTHMARGKVLDDYDKKAFEAGWRSYQKRNGPSLRSAYGEMMRQFYFASRERQSLLEAGRTGEKYRIKLKPATERPSFHQFNYWMMTKSGGKLPKRDRARHNPIEYKKDLAGRTGDAFANIIAFGQVFELDETPFDEELVSIFDLSRQTKIAKATLYFVIDRFSKYITGLYITTEAPSFKTVRQALFNTATDKSRFLAQYGFDPNDIVWDYGGVPTTLFVDNAEFRNRISEGAVSDLQTIINFARKGRGDDKPNVEQLFRIFSQWFKGLSKAHQTKSTADIAAQLARKHACLTITELYIIAIVYINYHNNYRQIPSYRFDRAMLQDNVPPIPAKLCEWSTRYRPGYTIHYPADELYMKLLPRTTVSVHQKGIYYPKVGLWYNSEWVLKESLQDRLTSRNRVLHLGCRFNENFVDVIFLETEAGLKPATLDASCSAYSGLSFQEVERHQSEMRSTHDQAKDMELEYQLGVTEVMGSLLKQAQKEKVPGPMQKLSKINDNRKLEAVLNRYSDIERYLEAVNNGLVANGLPEDDNNHVLPSAYDDFYEEDE